MRLTVRIARAVALAVAAGLVVSGCAGGTSYDDDTARDLQQQTLAVTTAAADGDWNAAAMRLMALEADARDAHARGLVSTERLESIVAAIALVAASVEAERVAAEQAEAERAEREASEQAQREQAEREQAEREASEGGGGSPRGPGSDNSGPGNNSGNGRGGGRGNRD